MRASRAGSKPSSSGFAVRSMVIGSSCGATGTWITRFLEHDSRTILRRKARVAIASDHGVGSPGAYRLTGLRRGLRSPGELLPLPGNAQRVEAADELGGSLDQLRGLSFGLAGGDLPASLTDDRGKDRDRQPIEVPVAGPQQNR